MALTWEFKGLIKVKKGKFICHFVRKNLICSLTSQANKPFSSFETSTGLDVFFMGLLCDESLNLEWKQKKLIP